MVKKYNIAKAKKYFDKQSGTEKTQWQTCGVMTEFIKQDGSVSRILEIPAIGLEANIFPQEPRQPWPDSTPYNAPQAQNQPPGQVLTQNMSNAQTPPQNEPQGQISVEEIPF